MKCPKCDGEMRSGTLEFEPPWWFNSWSLRGLCCFWAEGLGRRELFSISKPPQAWYCSACSTVVVEKQS